MKVEKIINDIKMNYPVFLSYPYPPSGGKQNVLLISNDSPQLPDIDVKIECNAEVNIIFTLDRDSGDANGINKIVAHWGIFLRTWDLNKSNLTGAILYADIIKANPAHAVNILQDFLGDDFSVEYLRNEGQIAIFTDIVIDSHISLYNINNHMKDIMGFIEEQYDNMPEMSEVMIEFFESL